MTAEGLSPQAVRAALLGGGEVALVDVRDAAGYAGGHVLTAVSAPLASLPDLLARLVPGRAARLILCDGGEGLAQEAAQAAGALGYGNVGWMEGGMPAWLAAGHRLFEGVNVLGAALAETVDLVCRPPVMSAAELAARREGGEAPVVLDVRPWAEHCNGHVPDAISCPGGELVHRIGALAPDPRTTVVVHCAGRSRSLYGAQSLINAGVPHPVFALADGTTGWQRAGFALAFGSGLRADAAPGARDPAARAAARRVARACGVREIDARQLAQWQDESDARSLYLLDVRSPEEFAAGHARGAVSAQGVQLVECSDDWIGVRDGRVVLLDDDGVRAPMAASWLRQLGHGEVAVLAEGADDLAFDDVSTPPKDDIGDVAEPTPDALAASLASAAAYLDWQANLAHEVAGDGLVRLEPYRPDGSPVAPRS